MGKLRVGTCSWKYPSWQGLVYSQPKGINYLEEYSRRYTTVEIDQWFWSLFPKGKIRLPDPQDAEEYSRSVPKDFRFTVKAPNSITLTHYYSRGKKETAPPNPHFLSMDLFSDFLESLTPIHDLLGPIIFQFEYLNRKKMESQSAFKKAFGDFRRQLPGRFSYALEIRNKNYINDRFLGFLLDQNIIPVLLQGYWMPPIVELYEQSRDRWGKFASIILRLHGPDREGIEAETGAEWNRIVHARNDELAQIARITTELLDKGVEMYVNVNNHYEGSAPMTIDRFMEFLPKS